MITVEDIRKQAERAYPDYLRSVVSGEPFFPLDLRFGKRVPKGNYQGFAKKRDALLRGAACVVMPRIEEVYVENVHVENVHVENVHVRDAQAGEPHVSEPRARYGGASSGPGPSTGGGANGFVVELEGHNSRRYGLQMLPARIFFADEAGYAGFLGRTSEVRRVREVAAKTQRSLPALMPWLARHAPRVTGHLDRWDDLLAVCRYLLEHPRPDRYARELPISVHTKFIEENEGVLRQMLDFLLPAEAFDSEASDFARRYGMLLDEPLVRMRVLDPAFPMTSGWPAEDVSVPVSAMEKLDLSGCTVVISENKMTFLTIPGIENGLALWGGGFKIDVLRDVGWLRSCDVFYWGDLDAHGFMILSRLRSFLPDATSVMMDLETFESFRAFTVAGTPTETEALPHLSPAEQAVFQSLARGNLRLEQERVSRAYVRQRLSAALSSS